MCFLLSSFNVTDTIVETGDKTDSIDFAFENEEG